MGIFVNRTLNMKSIKALGFDMDHTLVLYKTEIYEEMVFKQIIHKLVTLKNYPQSIEKLKFEFNRSLKGLVLDKRRGNMVKLSLHGRVKTAFHGLEEINFKDRQNIYRGLVVDLNDDNYMCMDTAFSISHSILFSQLVQYRDDHPKEPIPDYPQLAEDILEVLDLAHRDDSLKKEVRENTEKYIHKDPLIPVALERFKQYGKKLLLITNSDYGYTKHIMEYAFDPFLKKHKNWTELFDVVVTFSGKPSFFTGQRPFLRVDPQTGLMANIHGPISSPGIYQGGNATQLGADLKLAGEEILYLGDHIFGDVVALKKSCHWRTALVLEDIDQEIEGLKSAKPFNDKIAILMEEKEKYQNELDKLYSLEFEFEQKIDKEKVKSFFEKIEQIDHQISPLIAEYNRCFNPYWGELMRAGYEESRFADQVKKYACIYMGKISDFLEISPRKYFRERRRLLAHEFE